MRRKCGVHLTALGHKLVTEALKMFHTCYGTSSNDWCRWVRFNLQSRDHQRLTPNCLRLAHSKKPWVGSQRAYSLPICRLTCLLLNPYSIKKEIFTLPVSQQPNCVGKMQCGCYLATMWRLSLLRFHNTHEPVKNKMSKMQKNGICILKMDFQSIFMFRLFGKSTL